MSAGRLSVVLLAVTTAVACASPQNAAMPDGRWWEHVEQLASEEMQGRRPGTDGYSKAAQYVAAEFQRLGLQPAGVNTFFQPVALEVRRLMEDQSTLELTRDGKIIPLRFGTEVILSPAGQTGTPFEAEVVFAGYGLTIAEHFHPQRPVQLHQTRHTGAVPQRRLRTWFRRSGNGDDVPGAVSRAIRRREPASQC